MGTKGTQPPGMGGTGGNSQPMNMAAGTGGGFGNYADTLKKQYATDPTGAYARFAYGDGGAGQKNQSAVRDALFGGDQNAMNQWINESDYGNDLRTLRNDPAAYARRHAASGGNPAAGVGGSATATGGRFHRQRNGGRPDRAAGRPGAPVATPSPLAPGAALPGTPGSRRAWNNPVVNPKWAFQPGQPPQGLADALMGGGGPRNRPWEFGGGSQPPWAKDPNQQIDFSQLGPLNNGNAGVGGFGTAQGLGRNNQWMGNEVDPLTPGTGPLPQAGYENPLHPQMYRQNRGNMDMTRGGYGKPQQPPQMQGGGKGRGLPGMQPTTM